MGSAGFYEGAQQSFGFTARKWRQSTAALAMEMHTTSICRQVEPWKWAGAALSGRLSFSSYCVSSCLPESAGDPEWMPPPFRSNSASVQRGPQG